MIQSSSMSLSAIPSKREPPSLLRPPKFCEAKRLSPRICLEGTVSADFENAAHSDLETPLHTVAEEDVEAPEPTAIVKSERGAAWTSAATTLDFFERLAAAKNRGVWAEFWNTRRGDIYLAIAIVLMLGVIRWAIWSSHSVSATGNPTVSAAHRAAPDADLSLFDRILVKLGVAEAPDPPDTKEIHVPRFGSIFKPLFIIARAPISTVKPRRGDSALSGTRNWTSLSPPIAKPAIESRLRASIHGLI